MTVPVCSRRGRGQHGAANDGRTKQGDGEMSDTITIQKRTARDGTTVFRANRRGTYRWFHDRDAAWRHAMAGWRTHVTYLAQW